MEENKVVAKLKPLPQLLQRQMPTDNAAIMTPSCEVVHVKDVNAAMNTKNSKSVVFINRVSKTVKGGRRMKFGPRSGWRSQR